MRHFLTALLLPLSFAASASILNSKYVNVPIDGSLIRFIDEGSCTALQRLDSGHQLPISVFDLATGKDVMVMTQQHGATDGKTCEEKLKFLKARLAEIQKIYGHHAKVIISGSNGTDENGKLIPGDKWIELNVAPGQAKLSGPKDPRAPKATVRTLPEAVAGDDAPH